MMTLSFALADNFIGAMKQFGYKTRLLLRCSNQEIKLSVPKELQDSIIKDRGNELSLDLGIKSLSSSFKVYFRLKEELKEEGFADDNMKFTIIV